MHSKADRNSRGHDRRFTGPRPFRFRGAKGLCWQRASTDALMVTLCSSLGTTGTRPSTKTNSLSSAKTQLLGGVIRMAGTAGQATSRKTPRLQTIWSARSASLRSNRRHGFRQRRRRQRSRTTSFSTCRVPPSTLTTGLEEATSLSTT